MHRTKPWKLETLSTTSIVSPDIVTNCQSIKPVIPPVSPETLEAELATQTLLRHTNKGANIIYVVNGNTAPNVMREIGRLREIAFRTAGGGTGKECDIDEFDTMQPPCLQLIVWDPDGRQILGGYRFIIGPDIKISPDGLPRIATSHLFDFSRKFLNHYLPLTLELGRSFVRLEYQSTRAGSKAIYVLDNLWDGLGALTVIYPEIKYLFGKVTMYPNYAPKCRDLILHFLGKHFPDNDNLVWPRNPLQLSTPLETLERLIPGNDFADDYRVLRDTIRAEGLNIPPLVNAYMSLSPTMRMFGTSVNDEFGNVEEFGIFLTISEILEEKKLRHIASFQPQQ